jgi:hypothetical protein
VLLAEEFRERRSFYQAEIKKLTDIISLSSVDVRRLVMEKTNQAKLLEQRQEKVKLQRPPPTRPEQPKSTL